MSSRARPRWGDDARAVLPIAAKAVEAGLVVLFIGVLTTGLYAGAVPEYRSATATDIGDRTVVAAGNEIERAVPPDAAHVRVEANVELPATIRSEPYRLVVVESPSGVERRVDEAAHGTAIDPDRDVDAAAVTTATRIELEHPHPAVEGAYALALPPHVDEVRGELSGGDGRIVIRTAADGEGLVVTLEDDE